MPTMHRYVLPVDVTHWTIGAAGETAFTWEYDDGSADLLRLYEKGKAQQWNASERIDWSHRCDPDDPMKLADESIPLFGSPMWKRMGPKDQAELRYHSQVHSLSNFMHGEQGALICSAKIVQTVPTLPAKLYAATQVVDEARHVEAYKRLLAEQFRFVYPINPPLKVLLEQALSDSRWDFTYLAMQVMIEGLALAAFQRIRDHAKDPLCSAVNAYVMQDEARHVAFGRIALREYYPQLTEAERREREDFVIEASRYLRDRFDQNEVWQTLGLPKQECVDWLATAESTGKFRSRLFSRIVPTVKEIGLYGGRVQALYEEFGVGRYADIDAQAQLDEDARIAEKFDAEMRSLLRQ